MGGFCGEVVEMIIKFCTVCRQPMQYNGHSRCSNCRNRLETKGGYDKLYKRNKKIDRFYHSREWKELSRSILLKANASGKGCADCGGLATEVHHDVEVKDDWERRLDPTNLIPLCTSCHNRRR